MRRSSMGPLVVRSIVRPACGPGSLPAGIPTDGSDLPNRRGGDVDTRWLTPGVDTPPPWPNRASGEKGGVAPVLSLTAGAVRERRARTENTNNDSGKNDWWRGTPPTLFLVHPPLCLCTILLDPRRDPIVTQERSRRRGTARIRTMPPRD